MESVILVNEQDQMLGTMDKMAAHIGGKLHRAISVFIFNSRGQLLLQQRAGEKYHSGGQWSNTCCSHPRPGEKIDDAAHRRLKEEMGISCKLSYSFPFIYRAELANGLTEYEYDHVFFGTSDEHPLPDPTEVADYKYIAPDELAGKLVQEPGEYTEWLKVCFENVLEHIMINKE